MPAAAAERAAALRDAIDDAQPQLLRPRPADDQRRRIRRAVSRAAGARGANIRRSSRPIRRRSASAARAQPQFAPVRHAVPMLSIRTETDTTPAGAAQFDARIRRDSALAADAPPVEYIAELKFDGLAINLRYETGPARRRPRRAATARSARTSRATSARSARSRCGSRRRSAGDARRARRGLHDARRFRAPERAPARGRACARSSIRATRRPAPCASSIPPMTAQRPLQFFAYGVGEVARLAGCRRRTRALLDALAAFGLPVDAHRARRARRRRARRVLRAT